MILNEFRKIEKTRKEHKCACTGKIIPIGSSCWTFVGMFEGEFQSWYCTLEAKAFIDENYSTLYNGLDGFYCSEVGDLMRQRGLIEAQ